MKCINICIYINIFIKSRWFLIFKLFKAVSIPDKALNQIKHLTKDCDHTHYFAVYIVLIYEII